MEEEQSTDIPLGEMMCLREEGVGKGKKLVFPNMSSCAAFILVLDDDLIGIHKTMYPEEDLTKFQVKRATKLVTKKKKKVCKLYVAGWNLKNLEESHHDVQDIARKISKKLGHKLPIFVSDYGDLTSQKPIVVSDSGDLTSQKPIVVSDSGDLTSDVTVKSVKSYCTFAELDKNGEFKVGVRPNDKVYCSSENQFKIMKLQSDIDERQKLRETKDSRGEKLKFAVRALSYEEEVSTTIETTEECNFQEFETQATTKSVSIATEDAVHYWC